MAFALLATATATACADVEGLQSEGDLGEAHAPLTLWGTIHPSPAAPGENPGTAAPVPGLPPVPGGSMRGVDALDVVRADITSATRRDKGTGRLVDPRAAQRLALCTQAVDGGPDCPVRPPVLHDLTGDGKEDLITAVDLDGRLSELRVYSVQNGRVTRILARRAVLAGVEVAADHLAVREPTSTPTLVSISDYEWDPDSGVMALAGLTLDECAPARDSTTVCAPSET
ncbi:hypothetical protein DEJ50_16980 [Streptomyces venezuelae]|uniref:VCBS repeat-containing protein n=1 Tax=Streptomyces venezuelae TaxID=54571 RepID=A0A5P2DE29_STRVZ|nr:hypothetical protein DEJ50_16980 [Streptomyces venezuelae]